MGPIQEIQMFRIGGGLVQVSKSPVSRWMLLSIQGNVEEESHSELSLGWWCEYLQGLGCIVGMSFSKCKGCGVSSSQAFTEGEAEERGMLF